MLKAIVHKLDENMPHDKSYYPSQRSQETKRLSPIFHSIKVRIDTRFRSSVFDDYLRFSIYYSKSRKMLASADTDCCIDLIILITISTRDNFPHSLESTRIIIFEFHIILVPRHASQELLLKALRSIERFSVVNVFSSRESYRQLLITQRIELNCGDIRLQKHPWVSFEFERVCDMLNH